MPGSAPRLSALLAAVPALLLASDAGAVRQPAYLTERPLEPALGKGRLHAPTSWRTPARAAKAWQRLVDARGPAWQAIWDLDRGVPSRVLGPGIAAPGASADPAIALDAARKALAAHVDLLAPGARPEDFQPVSNVVHGRDGGLRTVGFAQTHAGLRVLGGQVSFLFAHDRLIVMSSDAFGDVQARVPARQVAPADARDNARKWIEGAYGAVPTVLEERGPAILPIVREPGAGQPTIEHRVVTTLVLDLPAPRARWEVYVDLESGAPLARRQLLRFGAGTLRFNVPVRYPSGPRQDYPAGRATVTIAGQAVTTDDAGGLGFAGTDPVSVGVAATGPRVTVSNAGGASATATLALGDGGSATWDAGGTATVEAQLAGFIHASLAKAYARTELAPGLGWLDAQQQVFVNESGRCNAYSTGDDIHFYAAGGGCENTGRLADVVYHEFGHSLHYQSIIDGAGAFDPHLSEGTSDYLAATMSGDPGMGRGFFVGSTTALRNLDPSGREYVYPRDMDPDPHASGLIIAGALWDLRKELVASLGADAGRRQADDYFYAILQRASDIPSTYVEVLAADDDDGDLANGTPHKCVIDRTFAAHGLVDPELALGVHAPVRDGYALSVAITPPAGGCPAVAVSGVTIEWKLRGDVAPARTVAMTAGGPGWQGALPAQPDGSVIQYKVTVALASGLSLTYPDNLADPFYELYVGPLVPVYCTDFESDPFAAGWTHRASGASDDWEWGVPAGDAGDPDAAVSGLRAIGTDLGTAGRDGVYNASTSTTLVSPTIDVRGRSGLRLQYRRWLGVEDGFFDKATITADGTTIWSNFSSPSEETASVSHRDREWRLHDLDLGAAGADGTVQIGFTLETDQAYELGGWTLDDFCIMARGTATCGNGALDPGETCDDGNGLDGDGCSAVCVDEDGGDEAGGCCSTGGGSPAGPIALGLATAVAALRRRRRA